MKTTPARQPITAVALTRTLTLTLSLTLAALTPGCVVSIGGQNRTPPPPPPRQEPPKPNPVVVVPSLPEDTATLAEIDAIAGLSFENTKTQGFLPVASRPGLSPAAQVHLVNTSLRSLSFEHSKVTVLLAVIANPSFNPATKEAILRQLDMLAFENSKATVLNAIQQGHPTTTP